MATKKAVKGTTTVKTRALKDGSSITTAKTTDPNMDLRTLFPPSKARSKKTK